MRYYWLIAVFILVPFGELHAVTQQQIDQIKGVVEQFCLSGTQYQFDANADGSISIKGLLPGAEGSVTVNIKTARGGVGYLNEQVRRIFDEETRRCMQPYIDKIINLILNVTPGQGEFAGTWAVIDPRTGAPFTTVELMQNGGYRGSSWGRNWGGSNGLGANHYQFESGVLKFTYLESGRARIDEMLVGSVRRISDYEFSFKVIGGYYGNAQNSGVEFLFRRQ